MQSEIDTDFDPVVQLVRILACHASGRGFESRPDRKKFVLLHNIFFIISDPVVQLVRILACHASGRGFESRPDRNFL